jgi:hypothetical protein
MARVLASTFVRGLPALVAGNVLTCLILAAGAARTENEPVAAPQFYRAFNLNGPALVIDGQAWEAGDAADLSSDDAEFENQSVALAPPTDAERARMIRSSRWSPAGQNGIVLSGVPEGTYSVFLYVWEDNDSQTFDVLLEGSTVAVGQVSGQAGHWDRLGPWVVEIADGTIELASRGGHANFSGLEIWRGVVEPDAPAAAPPSAASETAISVLLARNCLECHNGSDRKGGLDLTRRDGALSGGDSGPAIVPGSAEASLLVRRIEAREMPPAGREPLSEEQSNLLRDWVAAGAAWESDPIDPFLYTSDRRAGYNWWSLQPPHAVEPPAVRDESWPAGAIDRFVLHGLEEAGLKPSPSADRRTLIRRLTFGLLGLPPTPEEVAEFVAEESPDAYARLVDRLLDSPHYGEHWGRHWLDIVRFGESQGFERNKLRPGAWRYRDFVVEAFNSDLPYDDFVRWQVAGDVLRPDDPLAVVASGFLVAGPYDLTAYTDGTSDMRAAAREEELEGLVGTVCQTFLGLTANCARCHDHKFDPVSQREYYQIAAALRGTYHGDERESLSEAGRGDAAARIEALRSEMAALDEQAAPADERRRAELAAERSRKESLLRLLEGGAAHLSVPQEPGVCFVLARGDFRQPGESVSPAGAAALGTSAASWNLPPDAPEAERRRALALWIADEHNPLLARVIVNRLWGYHFGAGLVATPSDFGFQGGYPSHPELLDWLAAELVHPSEGAAWSLKHIQRLILHSAAYRQSSRAAPAALAVDADNRLIWRRPPQRLEAEAFRDAVLAVSGDLDRSLGGPGYRDWTVTSAGNNETYTVFDAIGPEFNRRTLYRTWLRTGTSPLLDVLDCPDPSVATPRRLSTATPLQALALLNNAFMERQAARFAERVQRETPDDATAQLRRAFELAFARLPADEEASQAEAFVAAHGLPQLCLVLLNTSEFLYVD